MCDGTGVVLVGRGFSGQDMVLGCRLALLPACGLLAARGFQACNPRESLKLSTVLSPYLGGAERDHVQLCAAALT